MEVNEVIIHFEKQRENNISKKIKEKANRIHLELLSFIQKELLSKNSNSFLSFSSQQSNDKSKNWKNKFLINNCIINDEQKSNDVYYSDDNEELEDNSSDISAEEETII